MSVEFHVDPRYIEDLPAIELALSNTLAPYAAFLEPGSQELKVVNIDKDNIELKYQYTLKSLSRDVQREIRKKLMRTMLESLEKPNRCQSVTFKIIEGLFTRFTFVKRFASRAAKSETIEVWRDPQSGQGTSLPLPVKMTCRSFFYRRAMP